jgi:hypothetical protein
MNMMYKKKILLLTALSFASLQAKQGMWIPSLLKALNKEQDMQSMGMTLSSEDIYSLSKNSLKDAIVQFGNGCTGEVMSEKGLVFTNFHCADEYVQAHATVEKNYLKTGFWASNLSEELPNPGLSVTFIKAIEEVSHLVLQGMDTVSENRKNIHIKQNIQNIIAAQAQKPYLQYKILPFDYGTSYFLFTTQRFEDVRLVGAPPHSLAQFGVDSDNWVFPRHNADFSVFRIYADSLNNPVEYSTSNKPYKASKYLKISNKGVAENDFAWVYGFPGKTAQHLSSYSLTYLLKNTLPIQIKMRTLALQEMDIAMREDEKTRMLYTAKQASVANAWKKWQGQERFLRRYKVIQEKQKEEEEILAKLAKDTLRKQNFTNTLQDLQMIYKQAERFRVAKEYFLQWRMAGPDIFKTYTKLAKLIDSNMSFSEKKNQINKLSEEFYSQTNLELEKKLFEVLVREMYNNISPYFVTSLSTYVDKYQGDFNKMVEELYANTFFRPKYLATYLQKVKEQKLKEDFKNDPLTYFHKAMTPMVDHLLNQNKLLDDKEEELMHEYVKIKKHVFADKVFAPDANFTLRVAYGKVESVKPNNGAKTKFYTTMEGLMAKYLPGDYEYDLPAKMHELFENKDYGKYAYPDGSMRLCFIASNHTTGGNSGSPVLNAKGEFIGINFDRTWESTMSDYYYAPDVCRNIAVDAKYILFILDKFASSEHILKELDIVN